MATTYEFKEGDKIKMKIDCTGCVAGEIYTVHYGNHIGEMKETLYVWPSFNMINKYGCCCQVEWELVEEEKKEENPENFVVHVETLDEWKAVLTKAFSQGYGWPYGDIVMCEDLYQDSSKYLFLFDDKHILYGIRNNEPTWNELSAKEYLGENVGWRATNAYGELFKEAESFSVGWAPLDPIKNSSQKEGKSIMSTLKEIPNKIKRFINANYRAFYKLGWVDEDLDLTETGSEKLHEFLLDLNEVKFGEYALKEVKKLEKKDKKDKEEDED